MPCQIGFTYELFIVIRKTEGIVLRTLRHQDSNLITTLYTRDFGIR
ncbi:MAG: recombination protein O N-terminal domain-containing protein, partial [Bacteroidetes bacterium]|nr:recombination protein O N-terminal domain-containing protein [Bacteroidota bacterium]